MFPSVRRCRDNVVYLLVYYYGNTRGRGPLLGSALLSSTSIDTELEDEHMGHTPYGIPCGLEWLQGYLSSYRLQARLQLGNLLHY